MHKTMAHAEVMYAAAIMKTVWLRKAPQLNSLRTWGQKKMDAADADFPLKKSRGALQVRFRQGR